MALNYTSIQALINTKYLPTLYDNIFTKTHYMWARIKAKAKTYNERKIVLPLEYADGSNAQPTLPYGVVNLQPIDPITAAEYEPKMVTDSLVISLEEELVANSDQAVLNLITAKMNNVKKGMEKAFATRLWSRTAATAGVGDWLSLSDLIGTTNTVGGIDGNSYSWWRSKVLDATTLTGDPSLEDDLMDPTKDTYLKKLLQRGIALAKYLTGENPKVIAVPQYIYDLIEFILDPQKTGSKMSERAGSMGFTALDFRGIDIVADDDMVAAQTGDTDGRMYFVNDDYLYAFFNEKAKFKAQDFVRPANMNAKSCLINAYGNMVISNRAAQSVITNIRSPKTYSTGE